MSDTPAQLLLRNDPRTATAAEAESVSLPESHARALLEELGPDERAESFYHHGWGYAVLTPDGLILFPSALSPRLIRAPAPLSILRRASGLLDSVEILAEGRPRRLNGSKLDPKGELLQAVGEFVPAGSPARPGRRGRIAAWARRRPVSACAIVAAFAVFVNVAEPDSGSGAREAAAQDRAEPAAAVPDFAGATLTGAAARARSAPWRTVSSADASSGRRPVALGDHGWRVCFQKPSRDEVVIRSATALTLYAVPEREECPTRPLGPRRVLMPDVVGDRLVNASRALDDLGLHRVLHFHAHTGERLDGASRDLDDQHVCRQRPAPNAEVAAEAQVDLWLIAPGDSCAAPSPTPKPKPKPKPEPEAKPKPRPKPVAEPRRPPANGGGPASGPRGGSSSGSGTGTGGSGTGTGGSGGGSGTRAGVGFGQSCAPVGSTATTADGRPARCFMGKDGRARWGYRS
ncbi:hypothetical protein [Streptomyces sp. NPDC014894]|uniref:hypothetical protein n=1 Tax=Streptomyces sp. NPDC014894 TaxID=3364931 RepID=UPI0036F5E633